MLQATTVRYLGVFLEDPLDVPWPVVEYLAGQLGIADASCVKRYTARAKTAYEHAWEIRDAYGFRAFEDPGAAADFRLFLEGRAWTHAEGPYRLFGQAVAWLRRNRVLLPGVNVLARLVAGVREAAADRMHLMLASAAADADPALPSRLRSLLAVPDGQRVSELERLRQAPRRTSGKAMTGALDRVSEVLALRARSASVDAVPANRLAALARYGLAAKAPALRDLAEPRKTATLLATARHLEAAAVDDALDLFDVLMATRLISTARRASAAERLAAAGARVGHAGRRGEGAAGGPGRGQGLAGYRRGVGCGRAGRAAPRRGRPCPGPGFARTRLHRNCGPVLPRRPSRDRYRRRARLRRLASRIKWRYLD